MLVRIVYVLTEFPVCCLVSSLRLWDVSDAKKHLQVIKAKDKQGRYVCTYSTSQLHCLCVLGQCTALLCEGVHAAMH